MQGKKFFAVGTMIALLFHGMTTGLCFGADASDNSASVSVMAEVAATFDVSERVTVQGNTYSKRVEVSDLTVTNKSTDKIVTIKNITAEGSGGWSTVSEETIDTAARDTAYIYLSIDDNDLRADTGGYDLNDCTLKGKNAKRVFSIDGRIPVQTAMMQSTEIAKLILTLAVTDKAGGSDGDIDGFTIDYLKTVTWANGEDEEIVAVIKAIDEGKLSASNLTGWEVGAERTMYLPEISGKYDFTDTDGTNYTGSLSEGGQNAQNVTWVIMDAGGEACETKKWVDDGGQEHNASFIVGLKDCLYVSSFIAEDETKSDFWKDAEIRGWCNSTFYAAMLKVMGISKEDNFFKLVTNASGRSDGNTHDIDNIVTYDYFALPGEVEVTGSQSYSTAEETAALKQFEWYQQSTDNRAKYVGGESVAYWLRSGYRQASSTIMFLICGETFVNYIYGARDPYYMSPFFCL